MVEAYSGLRCGVFWSGAVNFHFKGGVEQRNDICSVLHLLMITGLTVCSFVFLWPLAGLCFRRYELASLIAKGV